MFDWKIAIFCLQTISTVVILSAFINIKFNDLKHLGKDVKEIKETVNRIGLKSDTNAEKIAKLEGKLE